MLDEALQKTAIQTGRDLMKGPRDDDPYEAFESDQQLRLPQPPLCKAAVAPEAERIPLTRDFSGLSLRNDLLALIEGRRSTRVYSGEGLTLAELAFLLYATQGVKGLRGRAYATLRTVPSGGARHPYETYLLVRDVEGLKPGKYHYLPMEHALEYLGAVPELERAMGESVDGQIWAAKAGVILYWTMVAYRAEWRYGVYAHRVALIDAGHIGQNLYLACEGLGLGTCGIGAFSQEMICRLFGLDGDEEFAVYCAPVGRPRAESAAEEKSFYRFVEEQNL